MFEEQSSVPDAMLPWRATVIAFKQPRRQLVQPVTYLQGDDVVLQVFPCLICPLLALNISLTGIRSFGCWTVRELRYALRAFLCPAPAL
jgi:hypothetical protein